MDLGRAGVRLLGSLFGVLLAVGACEDDAADNP